MTTTTVGLLLGIFYAVTPPVPAQTIQRLKDPPLARGASVPAPGKAPATGSYYRLKWAKIVDQQGFGQPVEVLRLVVPLNWKTDSGVRWNAQARLISHLFLADRPFGLRAFWAPAPAWQGLRHCCLAR